MGEYIARSSYPTDHLTQVVPRALPAGLGHRENRLHPVLGRAGIAMPSSGGMIYIA